MKETSEVGFTIFKQELNHQIGGDQGQSTLKSKFSRPKNSKTQAQD